MHAFLITGSTLNKRQEHVAKLLDEWNVASFDRIYADTTGLSIGIEQIRELEHRISLRPYQSPWSVLIINNADLLTTEAQNALLKTLEEPPPHGKIILESQTANVFLPTIISRCEGISLEQSQHYQTEDLLTCLDTIHKINRETIGQKLNSVDSIAKTREETDAWIDMALWAVHRVFEIRNDMNRKIMLKDLDKTLINYTENFPHSSTVKLLRALLNAHRYLAANVNYKLALDDIFIGTDPDLLPIDGVDRL